MTPDTASILALNRLLAAAERTLAAALAELDRAHARIAALEAEVADTEASVLHALFAAQKVLEAVPRLLQTSGPVAITEVIRICRDGQSETQIKAVVKEVERKAASRACALAALAEAADDDDGCPVGDPDCDLPADSLHEWCEAPE